jgi:hypothetical protein
MTVGAIGGRPMTVGETARRRTVAVHGEQQGSGVLVTDRLILTCAHVVGTAEQVSAARENGGGWTGCEVLYRSPDEAGIRYGHDVALLLAGRSLLPPGEEGPRPLVLGRFDDSRVPECRVYGYPHVRRDQRAGRDEPRLDEYRGTPLTATHRGRDARMDLELHGPAAAEPADGRSLLRGLSGGPVFVGGILMGTVVEVPADRLNHRLTFVPVTSAMEVPQVQQVLEQHYDRVPGRLPRARAVGAHSADDQTYEEQYAAEVRRQYQVRGVIGLVGAGRDAERVDLDPSYITLRVESLPERPGGEPKAPEQEKQRAPENAHTALTRHPWVLLEGKAGSGKTTLLSWLARRCAGATGDPAGDDRRDRGELVELYDRVPFVIKLRELHSSDRPLPRLVNLPRQISSLTPDPPDNWVDRVFGEGRALLLIDGLDEIAVDAREGVLTETQKWLDRYPRTRCIATARPGAVHDEWLERLTLTRAQLLPMEQPQIEEFVRRWYQAAAGIHPRVADWQASAADLIRQIAGNGELADLAETPLLCAALCALHLVQLGAGGELPTRLWDLLDRTLSMLLGRRDKRRNIDAPEGVPLDEAGHRQYLQPIAAWLVRGGGQVIEEARALRLIELTSGGRQGAPDPADVLRQLMVRTILRQARDGSYEFVHRTFQDFLAAAEIARTDNVGELLARAPEERWREVVRLAPGHWASRPEFQHELVEGLLALGDARDEEDERAALHTLAVACAFGCDTLDSDLWDRVKAALQPLVPPAWTRRENVVSSLGTLLLGLLPVPESLSGQGSRALAEIVTSIGGEAAMDLARRLAALNQPGVGSILAEAWRNFPLQRYAQEVLAPADLSTASLSMYTEEEVDACVGIGPVRELWFRREFSLEKMLPVLDNEFRDLDLTHSQLTDLDFLADRIANLEGLWLREFPKLENLEVLKGASRLRDLHFLEADTPLDASFLPHLRRLESLAFLRPAAAESPLSWLYRPSRLTNLYLLMPSARDAAATDPLPTIRSLWLEGVRDWSGLDQLAAVYPSLGQLDLKLLPGSSDPLDLTPFAAFSDLSVTVQNEPPGLTVLGGESLGGRLYRD